MTARLLSLGGAARPISTNRLAIAAGRVFSIALAFYLIRATRVDERLDQGLLLSAAVFVGLYVVFGRKGVLRPIILYLLATSAIAQVRLFADQTGIPPSFAYVIDLDRTVFGVVPNVWVQEHFYHAGQVSGLSVVTAGIYLSFFVSPYFAALTVWLKKPAFFPRYATTIALAMFIGLIFFITLPTAPPWMASQEGYIGPVHRVVEQLLRGNDSSVYGLGNTVVGVNQVAAMPSLHMGLTLLVVMTVWRFNTSRLLRTLAALYVAGMAVSLVYLGEHYCVDEFFGVLTALVAWYLASRVWSPEGIWLGLGSLWHRRAVASPPLPAASPVEALSQ